MSCFNRGLWLCVGVCIMLYMLPLQAGAKSHYPEGDLSSDEVKSLVHGKTAEVSFGKSDKGFRYFSPNGQFRQVRHEILKKGNWKVRSNGRLCTQFENSSWKCRVLVRKGEKYRQYIIKKDGKHKKELTYKKFHQGQKLSELNRSPLLPAGTLNKKKLTKLFSGMTVESVTANQGRVSMSYYDPTGVVLQMRKGVVRTGSWEIKKKNRICLQMEGLKEKCRIVVKEGDVYNKYIVKKNGQHQHSVTYRNFTAGNLL